MTKLQLSSDAIRLLFDNDSEMKLKLQTAVIDEMSKRYIKDVKHMLDEDLLKALNNTFRNEVINSLGEIKGYLSSGRYIILKDEIKSLIKTEIDKELNAYINECIKVTITDDLILKHMENIINNKLNFKIGVNND